MKLRRAVGAFADETGSVPAAFNSDRSWRFEVSRNDLWERISAIDDYPTWWPWLRSFDAGDPIEVGATWTCAVSPPLPYMVRFAIRFDRVEPGRLVDTTVTGDVEGRARLTLEDHPEGSSARLVSALRPANPLLRGFGMVARPLVEYGHDWILDEGRRQFVERAFP